MAVRRSGPWIWLIPLVIAVIIISRLPMASSVSLLMAPAVDALHAPVEWWQSFSLWFKNSDELQQGYLEAQKQVEQQASLIQETNSLRSENRQLRELLSVADIPGYHWSAAKVHGRSPDAMSQYLIVQTKGAASDDVVVSSDGLVGVVDSVNGGYATVRTILDASLAVPVTLPGSPLAALLRGQGNSLEVDFVPSQNAPEIGAILYTSGAGGLFPPGIAVARITSVEPKPGEIFSHVAAVPVAHWQRDNWLAIASNAPVTKP
ncbi:MAG TPA: rod shape-determining protein MreC [Mariprofundaceae bacterium]|nr:rod shape-determining protein MreC [Mariprofundaceae bacterium]